MEPQSEICENEEKVIKYSIEQLKVIYGDEFPKIMKSIDYLQLSSIDYFSSEVKEIEKEYNNFYTNINNNINIHASKITRIFKLKETLDEEEDKEKKELVLKINNEKVSIIKEIIFTHNQILETIKTNIICLKSFLNICQNFQKNTVHEFYEKEFDKIANNWLLLKLNFEKFNFTKSINESSLNQYFKDFIMKTCSKQKYLTMTIQNPRNFFSGEDNKKIVLSPEEEKSIRLKKDNHIKAISENQKNMIKLKMKNINDADTYFVKSTSFTELKGLLLENVTLKNNNILYLFPYLSKLKIKNCQSLEISIFKNMSTNLRKLYFVKNGFVNFEFKKIIKEYLLNSQSIRDNLEILSFANNNITKVDFSQIISNSIESFRALKELDFRKNKLSKFKYNKTSFPSLNFINLCDNNFNKNYFDDDNIIVLQTGNNFLMDSKFRFKYFNKLYLTITNNNAIPISYLNISYLPLQLSDEFFQNLKISPTLLNNLKKLVLSNNRLTCDKIFNFFSKIKEPIYLKKLNLNGNKIDDSFFEKYYQNNLAKIFPKLKNLSLSSNLIGDSKFDFKYKDNIPIKEKKFEKDVYKLRMMYKFIEMNKNLKKINITKNPISEIYTIVPEESKDADKNTKYIIKDENNRIIINGFFSFLVKIRDELLDKEKENNTRESFNVKFDCRSNINKYSDNYPYSDKPIIFKK